MNLQDFLEELKGALNGELPPTEIESNLRYYRDYVKQQQQQGKTETEILNQLGEPRLIARTIIDTFRLNKDPERKYHNTTYQNNGSRTNQEEEENLHNEFGSKVYHMPVWLFKVIVAVILLLIASVLFWIGGKIVKLIFKIGIPLLILYIIYSLGKEFFSKKLK